MSLDDDIRKAKQRSRFCINGIVDAINKGISDQIRKDYNMDLELADHRVEIGNVNSTMAGKMEFKTPEEMEKASADIKEYISTIAKNPSVAIEMVKKNGDL